MSVMGDPGGRVTPSDVASLPGRRVPSRRSSPSAVAAVEVAIASSSSAGRACVRRARNCSSFHNERSGLETSPVGAQGHGRSGVKQTWPRVGGMAKMGMGPWAEDDRDMSVLSQPGQFLLLQQVAVDHQRVGKLRERAEVIQRAGTVRDRRVLPRPELLESFPHRSFAAVQQLELVRRFCQVGGQGDIVGGGQSYKVNEQVGVDRVGGVGAEGTEALPVWNRPPGNPGLSPGHRRGGRCANQ